MLSTREKIMQAAETLFSDQGFASTSLREITCTAEVNLAAVNYHFGNKQQLIIEVFQYHMDRLNSERLKRLEKTLKSEQPVYLEGILRALIYPALKLSRNKDEGGPRFVKLVGRVYAENNKELHAFLAKEYGHVMKRFAAAVKTIMPDMPDVELRWQLDFVIGALTYVMADFGGHFKNEKELNIDAATEADRLVTFAAAGIRSFQPSRAQKDLFNLGGNVATPISINTQNGKLL